MARLKIRLLAGFDKAATVQVIDDAGNPLAGVFTGDEPLSAKVWSGDSTPVVFTPTVAWADAANALIDVAFPGTATATIQPAIYEWLIVRTDTNVALVVGDLVVDSTPGSGVFDLIGPQAVRAFLSDVSLSDDQIEYLPTAILVASETVRGYCGRYFTRRTTTKEYLPTNDGLIFLPEFPVNAVSVRTDLTTAIQITKARGTTQRARVSLVPTGLMLTSVSSAVNASQTLNFTAYPTIQSMAGAINALGNGWIATVSPEIGGWPSTDLYGTPTQGCLGSPATFKVYATDLADFDVDVETGVLAIQGNSRGYGWTDYEPTCPSKVLVEADLGFDVIPYPIQQAVAEISKTAILRQAQDQTIESERIGDYSYKIAMIERDVSTDVLAKLNQWRITRA